MRLEENDSTLDHLQCVFERFTELNEIGHGLDNAMSVSILLASLNRDYDPLITEFLNVLEKKTVSFVMHVKRYGYKCREKTHVISDCRLNSNERSKIVKKSENKAKMAR